MASGDEPGINRFFRRAGKDLTLRFFSQNLIISRLTTGMARRKRELLDILRERSKNGEAPARQAEPSRRTASAPSKLDASSSNTSTQEAISSKAPAKIRVPSDEASSWPIVPWIGIALLVGFVLLSIKFWPDGAAEASESEVDSSVAGVSEEPFAVLVAEYSFLPVNKTLAIQCALALRDQFPQLADTVLLTKFPPDDPRVFELWIGVDPDRGVLNELLRNVQEAQVQNHPQNPRPFASASIERRRPIATN